MKIAIIGSRTFKDYDLLQETMHNLIYEQNDGSFDNVTIVSGGAKGADSLGKRYASDHNLGYLEFKAKWKDLSHPDAVIREGAYGKYDAVAGHRRNTLIIEEADIVVAFHNGSKGTADSLRKARKMNKFVVEVKFL